MTVQEPPKQDAIDRLARELYDPRHSHTVRCGGLISLYDELVGRCPHCGSLIIAGPEITPERACQMLATLRARRGELGLAP